MSFANINIGTTPGDHSGDPLRVAFNKINNNFQQIANGNVPLNVNAPVQSVAGRTGNVVITANDVLGSVTIGDVNAALTEFGQDYALNTYVDSEITGLVGTAPANLNTLGKIAASLGNNSSFASSVNSDISTLNSQISALWANALVQSDDLNALHSDIAAANLAIAQNSANIQVLFANAASQSAYLLNLTSNAASQAGELLTLTANAAAQQNSLVTLTSNAAVQDASLSDLLANAAAQQSSLASLLGNASSQQSTLTTLLANVVTIEAEIAGANAAIVTANTAMKGYVDAQSAIVTTAWTANASQQATQIVSVSNSVAGANAAIVTANTAMKGYVDAQATSITNAWTANAALQQGQIATLQAQAYTNSNVANYLPTYSGNLTAGNIVSTSAFGEHKLLGNLVIGGNISKSQPNWVVINPNAEAPIASIATVQIVGEQNKTTQLLIDTISDTSSGSVLHRRTRGNLRAPTTIQEGDTLGSFAARGFSPGGFSSTTAPAGINIRAGETFTDSSQSTFVSIHTIKSGSNTSVTHTKFEENGNLVIANGSPSTSFNTGALVVFGGAGVAGNIHASGSVNASTSIAAAGNITTGGTITSHGSITSNGSITANGAISSLGAISTVSTISASGYYFSNGAPLSLPFNNAGADSHIQLYGKNAYIANIQMANSTFTGDGSGLPLNFDFPQTNISHILKVEGDIIANSSTISTSAYTGALTVPYGGVGIQGNLFCAAKPNSRFQVGQGGSYLPNVIAQFTSDLDGAGQINMQNIRTSANAASEIVASANDGTQYSHYATLGICNSVYNNPTRTAYKPLDAYLNADGGNLLISAESSNTSIKFLNGGYNTSNVIGTWNANNFSISTPVTLTSAIQFANLTTAQVAAITSPQPGMTVFNYTTGNIQVYNGTKWANVTLS